MFLILVCSARFAAVVRRVSSSDQTATQQPATSTSTLKARATASRLGSSCFCRVWSSLSPPLTPTRSALRSVYTCCGHRGKKNSQPTARARPSPGSAVVVLRQGWGFAGAPPAFSHSVQRSTGCKGYVLAKSLVAQKQTKTQSHKPVKSGPSPTGLPWPRTRPRPFCRQESTCAPSFACPQQLMRVSRS
jgi:hypothetical protein